MQVILYLEITFFNLNDVIKRTAETDFLSIHFKKIGKYDKLIFLCKWYKENKSIKIEINKVLIKIQKNKEAKLEIITSKA